MPRHSQSGSMGWRSLPTDLRQPISSGSIVNFKLVHDRNRICFRGEVPHRPKEYVDIVTRAQRF